MKLGKTIKTRIKFKNTLELSSSLYEVKVIARYGANSKISNDMVNRMKINKENFLMLNDIHFIRYKKAIELYNSSVVNNPNTDDVRKAILLFFPFLLKCVKMDEMIKPVVLNEFTDKKIGKQIFDFIENYRQLEIRGLLMHRKEIFMFLEVYLNMLTINEIERITFQEKRDLLLFHYFRPFLRPELYFNYDNKEEI
jgi:hypothetical protein